MYFSAIFLALAPLFFLALPVHAQGKRYTIVNPVTGLVIEDHNWAPLQVGNPITGSQYTGRGEQLWEVVAADATGGGRVRLRRDRLVGRQSIHIGVDDLVIGGRLSAQNEGSSFFLFHLLTRNGIFSFNPIFAPFLAITAPSVANGTLTLQPFNITDQYQHWVFVSPGTPQISFPPGTNLKEESPKV